MPVTPVCQELLPEALVVQQGPGIVHQDPQGFLVDQDQAGPLPEPVDQSRPAGLLEPGLGLAMPGLEAPSVGLLEPLWGQVQPVRRALVLLQVREATPRVPEDR